MYTVAFDFVTPESQQNPTLGKALYTVQSLWRHSGDRLHTITCNSAVVLEGNIRMGECGPQSRVASH